LVDHRLDEVSNGQAEEGRKDKHVKEDLTDHCRWGRSHAKQLRQETIIQELLRNTLVQSTVEKKGEGAALLNWTAVFILVVWVGRYDGCALLRNNVRSGRVGATSKEGSEEGRRAVESVDD